MPIDVQKMRSSLAAMGFGLLKIALGIFGIWGQIALAEKGTHYGFCWPDSLHNVFIDLRSVNLFVFSIWFIYTGISGSAGERRSDSTNAG